ncbi:MAG: hypothetical protein ACOC04_00440 [Halothece sp.]
MNKIRIERELYIHRYIQALDHGDMDGVAEVLDAALYDPELERIITEIDLAYHEEEELTPITTDAELVRKLLRQHFQSAFENQENSSPIAVTEPTPVEETKLLTVGDVVKRLQGYSRLSEADQHTLENLLNSKVPLPKSLSIRAIRQLFKTELKRKASEKLLDSFRNTAIMLGIGRSHNNAQLAAAREQKGRYKNLKKNTNYPSTSKNKEQ